MLGEVAVPVLGLEMLETASTQDHHSCLTLENNLLGLRLEGHRGKKVSGKFLSLLKGLSVACQDSCIFWTIWATSGFQTLIEIAMVLN